MTGSVAGAIVALSIVGIIVLWKVRRNARQAAIVAAGPNKGVGSHHHPVVRHAELPQYAYSTQGTSELFGEGRRGQDM